MGSSNDIVAVKKAVCSGRMHLLHANPVTILMTHNKAHKVYGVHQHLRMPNLISIPITIDKQRKAVGYQTAEAKSVGSYEAERMFITEGFEVAKEVMGGKYNALDTFNTNVISPVYYVMFTSVTIVASVIMFKSASEIATEICGFVTILCGTWM
ncbi:Magnesium transporter NIPA [Artemisia annua]|uniref:Probable magnesium transporter n=1 Tax=Artemisia annua TaxID=35608 RepID=A0A2U1M9E4_ARTAN|nr:Magnesium transporter NIPA [Artemisia annua]